MHINAIILAAGTSSRFVPLSQEIPKGLLEVKGEILIERQIRQLKEAGITDITVVTGYMAERFEYLKEKFDIKTVFNEDFGRYNNTSSLIRVLDILDNTYICSSDNYFPENVFIEKPETSYYSALYANGKTTEYCLETNEWNEITGVTVGGRDSWYMMGHVFFSSRFSTAFKSLLAQEYDSPETKKGYWEDVYLRHLNALPPLSIRRYKEGEILEFDTLEDLRAFDLSYMADTRSPIIKEISRKMNCHESDLRNFKNIAHDGANLLFSFEKEGIEYRFDSADNSINRKSGKMNPLDRDFLSGILRRIFPECGIESAGFVRIGGMSNKNFKVSLDGLDYVLRIPGNGSEGMVDRADEEYNTMVACRLGVTPPVRYFNPSTGIKLTDFIRNAETLTEKTIQSPDSMTKIARIFRTVHNSEVQLRNEFNIFREIEKYDRLIGKANAIMYEGWETVRPQVMALEKRLETLGAEHKPCHNDPLYENFIKAEDGTIYLIDWEYSGMNDPMADFAALFLEAGFEKDNEAYILEKYFDGSIPPISRVKILCYQVLWDYLWAQWTIIKEAKGDDFGSYGIDRFRRAISNLKLLNDDSKRQKD